MLKLYVLIREDLTEAQQAVQAGHAVAQFAREHPKKFEAWQDDNNTLIYLSVKNIYWWKEVLEDGEFSYSMFCDPDLARRWISMDPDDKPGLDTAIAVAPNFTTQHILFKHLPLAFQPPPMVSLSSDPTVSERVSALERAVERAQEQLKARRRWWQR